MVRRLLLTVMAATLACMEAAGAATGGVGPSGTLPVLYINTVGGQAITTKTDYVDATCYLDSMGAEGVEAMGSSTDPLPTQIRGRGNYTWAYFDKKPYRLKLASKQPLLGMSASRHFALMAHADDRVAFLRNTVGFELSRRMGLPFTPAQEPVEVVLNGDYIGLYFLTETIRVAKNRLNIVEQDDGDTDEDNITGGWLVELDNNDDDHQIKLSVAGTDLEWLWVTYHSPDSLSARQHDYLLRQMKDFRDAIYRPAGDSAALGRIVDLNSLARFYVIQEVLDHLEAFLGSCYLWKDRGDEKWKFGPVWDFGHAFNAFHSKDKFIYEDSTFPVSIISTIARFPEFQREVARVWDEFYPAKMEGLEDFMHEFLDKIAPAAKCNYERWPDYGNGNLTYGSNNAFNRLRTKVAWLEEQWRPMVVQLGLEGESAPHGWHGEAGTQWFDLQGRAVGNPCGRSGIFILKQRMADGTTRVVKVGGGR